MDRSYLIRTLGDHGFIPNSKNDDLRFPLNKKEHGVDSEVIATLKEEKPNTWVCDLVFKHNDLFIIKTFKIFDSTMQRATKDFWCKKFLDIIKSFYTPTQEK